MLSGSQVRERFLKYFEERAHQRVHSSSLVPANDPTLLFTNAGMNQFKDVFLGLEKRDSKRATTSQKCVRAGGKHNDLENVGFTNRHHTFFEMLGNFSFGDYFKQEAIAYAWELITSPAWFGVPANRLYCTIFKGEQGLPRDDEAEKYWRQVGVAGERIHAMGMKDNFWAMGDTGPCGPCSEIHYDMGPAASDKAHPECAAGKCEFPCPHDCGRYMEIWNLVFMQFDRDPSGKLNPLPKPSIDTGMGLERIAAALLNMEDPHKFSNYDTDLFVPLIERAAALTGVSLAKEKQKEEQSKSAASLRVIADHARASTFLIGDGVLPANEGRGYVLRKIMRRAIRHGRLLGTDKPFLNEMVFAVRDVMQGAYPELKESAERIAKVVAAEETRFAHTLDLGNKNLSGKLYVALHNQIVDFFKEDSGRYSRVKDFDIDNNGDSVSGFDHGQIRRFFSGDRTTEDVFSLEDLIGVAGLIRDSYGRRFTLSGTEAFQLYDTFGLPRDFIEDACRDAGVILNDAEFDAAMTEQRQRARASWKGGAKQSASPAYRELSKTVFEGYEQTASSGCEVLAIVRGGTGVQELKAGEEGEVVLDHTPFYADSGGQVGDVGWFYAGADHSAANLVAEVKGCVLPVQGVRAHEVVARHEIRVGDRVDAVVDAGVRENTIRNHTGTHLLHAALREVLGKHVKQAGSLVSPSHLRFDFSHFTAVADEELQDIEDLVNKEVLRNRKVETFTDVPIETAIQEYKAMALFGEKYGDKVRVIRIGDFSTELCGGIHTRATGEIGLIKLLREGSVQSGVRRLEAVTGAGSLQQFRKDHQLESLVANLVGRGEGNESPADALRNEMERQSAEIRRLKKELEQSRMKSASSAAAGAGESVQEIHGVKLLVHRADNLERAQLRVLLDHLRNKLSSGVVVLGSVAEGKVALVVGVTKDLTSRVQAGKLIGPIAQKVGGSGGGRPDMAEAGGKDPAALDAALGAAAGVLADLLKDEA